MDIKKQVLNMNKIKFYNLNKILSKNATYNMIIGERSNGKTYSVLKYAVEEYFKTGGQVAIVRRWREDVIGRRASGIFEALNKDDTILKISKGRFEGVAYWSGKFYVCNYDEKTRKPILEDSNIIGYCFALSENEHNKSVSFPLITTIFFDEFLTKNLYLPDEFVIFMNTISTIVRQRDNVKIFMCGNTVNKFSPYFAEMGLKHIEKQEQGTIDVYKYGDSKLSVAVEYCNSIAKQKKSNFYFAFDNPKLQMITGGSWELDIYPHLPIKYRPKDIVMQFFIEFNDKVYHCDVVKINTDIFIYAHDKTTPIKGKSVVYSLRDNSSMWYNKNIFKPVIKIGAKIAWLIERNKIFYQDNEVGNAINNYFKICKGGL